MTRISSRNEVVCALDIDGVLNVVPQIEDVGLNGPFLDYEYYPEKSGYSKHLHRRDHPQMLGYLLSHTDLYWCTAHRDAANQTGRALGMPAISRIVEISDKGPHGEPVDVGQLVDDRWTKDYQNRHFIFGQRLFTLQRKFRGQPLLWIDDDIDTEVALDWTAWRTSNEAPTKVICVNNDTGLMPADMGQIHDWLERI